MYNIFYDRLIEDLSKWNFYRKIGKGCFLFFFFFDMPYQASNIIDHDGKWIIRSF